MTSPASTGTDARVRASGRRINQADELLTTARPPRLAAALEKYAASAPPELKKWYEDKIKYNQVGDPDHPREPIARATDPASTLDLVCSTSSSEVQLVLPIVPGALLTSDSLPAFTRARLPTRSSPSTTRSRPIYGRPSVPSSRAHLRSRLPTSRRQAPSTAARSPARPTVRHPCRRWAVRSASLLATRLTFDLLVLLLGRRQSTPPPGSRASSPARADRLSRSAKPRAAPFLTPSRLI
jgi:hypothetical protein